jgi:cytochrome c oxidase assembly factor CtaG
VTYVAAALALALYAQGFVRLRRRRPDRAPAWAAWCFVGGIVVAVAAVESPLDRLAEDSSLTAHMVQHLLLGDVAPLLLAAGLVGPLALFALPAGALRVVARVHRLRQLRRPSVAFACWTAAVYTWHVPRLYDAALDRPALHVVEHASFVTAGLAVWMLLLDRRRSPGRRAAFAGLILLAGMPLAEILISTGPIYPSYPSAGGQVQAGLVMMAEQVATLGTAALLLLRVHLDRVGTVPVNP